MNASNTLYKWATLQGWGIDAQLDLVLQYIESQASDDAFDDFLAQVAEFESATLTLED